MEKVYLLLRNNVESGPYSLNELLTQQLRPTDMLWIQGRSTAWTYLSEMELNIHEEPAAAAAPGKRLVGDEIEQKAEEIRKRALNFKPRSVFVPQEPAAEGTEYGRNYRLPGEEEIELIDHRKKDNRIVNEVVMTSVIICLFAGGLYFGSSYLHTRKEIISPAATEIVSEPKARPAHPEVAAVQPEQQHSLAKDSGFLQSQTYVFNEKPAARMALSTKNDTINKTTRPVPVQAMALQPEEINTTTQPQELEAVPEKKETEPAIVAKKTEVKKEAVQAKNTDTNASEDDEKKGLGKAISRLFKKKKNKDEGKND